MGSTIFVHRWLNVMRWLTSALPSVCQGSRNRQVQSLKKELQLDASKTGLVIKEQTMTQETNLTSDLALYQAMQRRALAMDLTNLASYEVFKKNGQIACLQSSPNLRRLAFRRFLRPSFLELLVKLSYGRAKLSMVH